MNKGILIKQFIENFMEIDLLPFINSCLMKEPKELIYHLLIDELTKNEKEYIQQKAGKKELSSFRDKRDPIQYAKNLCCSWITEEAIKKKITSWGYKILNYGCDMEREILTTPKRIKNDSDIIFEFKKNIFIKIEITQDYFDFVFKNKKYGFRYNKYQEIKEDNGYIIHLCLKKGIFYFFHINEIEDIQKQLNYKGFGGKPTTFGNIEDLPFYPLEKFKEIILNKLSKNPSPFERNNLLNKQYKQLKSVLTEKRIESSNIIKKNTQKKLLDFIKGKTIEGVSKID